MKHDNLVKVVFSNPDNAKALFKKMLPPKLVELIDLSTIEEEDKSFIDQGLQTAFADLVFRCKFKGSVDYIALLFEHQSYSDKLVNFQLIKYMNNIWTYQISKGEDPTPIDYSFLSRK